MTKRTGRLAPGAGAGGRVSRWPALLSVIEGERVRKTVVEGRKYYAVVDVLEVASEVEHPEDYWAGLLRREPGLSELWEELAFPAGSEVEEEAVLIGADLMGVLRILEAVSGRKTESVKRWMAQCCAERMEESENPELAVIRARREYERQGLPRRWIDQRMRSISTRAEVVSEWHKRGAQTSEDFRELTNALMQEGFGMDVETYRQHKGLFGRENLRDQMTEMELVLVSLGEAVAATLHRSHGSKAMEELEQDMRRAGGIVAETRKRIEGESGLTVVEGERRAPAERRNPAEGGREVVYRRGEGRGLAEGSGARGE
ncbi:MAG: hypothetical protein ACTHN5_20750 [Phycisphaerae bacterium]